MTDMFRWRITVKWHKPVEFDHEFGVLYWVSCVSAYHCNRLLIMWVSKVKIPPSLDLRIAITLCMHDDSNIIEWLLFGMY